MIHELKIWPEYFNRVISYEKRFEYRLNDKDFCFNVFLGRNVFIKPENGIIRAIFNGNFRWLMF